MARRSRRLTGSRSAGLDGTLVNNTEGAQTTRFQFELLGLKCAHDFGAPTAEIDDPRFTFTGTIHPVTYDPPIELIRDDDAGLAR